MVTVSNCKSCALLSTPWVIRRPKGTFILLLQHSHSANCDSTYRKVPVVGRLDFELWGCKVKISQNMDTKSILRFYILWNLQYLIFKLHEGFGAKLVFPCQNWPLNCKNTNTLYRFPNFKAFSQNQLFTNLLWYPQ